MKRQPPTMNEIELVRLWHETNRRITARDRLEAVGEVAVTVDTPVPIQFGAPGKSYSDWVIYRRVYIDGGPSFRVMFDTICCEVVLR